MLSNALVNAGMISFDKIASTNPRELELVKKDNCNNHVDKLNWYLLDCQSTSTIWKPSKP